MVTSARIVFAGTPDFAVPCLQALLNSHHQVVAVYTQADRPAGRGMQMLASPVKQAALAANIPIEQPQSLRDQASQQQLSTYQPDVMVVVGYGMLLPQAVLNIPNYGCVNVHTSLLPRWRGAAPVQYSIMHGDEESGVTIMLMDEGMDTGPVLAQYVVPIASDATSGELYDSLFALGAKHLSASIDNLLQGHVAIAQDDGLATYAKKIRKADACLNWSESAIDLERKIRAYQPWPVAYSYLAGTSIRFFSANVGAQQTSAAPGTIVQVDDDGIGVATADGMLVLTECQLAGKKRLAVAEILKAKRELFQIGSCFSDGE